MIRAMCGYSTHVGRRRGKRHIRGNGNDGDGSGTYHEGPAHVFRSMHFLLRALASYRRALTSGVI